MLALPERFQHAFAMRLSRRVQYAICGIFDLAYHGGGEPVGVQAIGQRQQIPYRFLEQIFAKLRTAKLIQGKRGPGGGYTLTRPADSISLREIVEAVEGPLDQRAAADMTDWPRSNHRPDFLFPLLGDRVAQAFGEITIADVCRDAARRSVDRDLPGTLDYQI